ncbi:Calcium-independent phospholipase A2-gamma [Aphelenchoides besseyi]|nr:Calcium-independent phospholipase A2-gamma [Aphelenchoides besseyi]KAI6200475.1 Calcium-independent phospholipase A2-gamma [Aphelenchoides besseyi]
MSSLVRLSRYGILTKCRSASLASLKSYHEDGNSVSKDLGGSKKNENDDEKHIVSPDPKEERKRVEEAVRKDKNTTTVETVRPNYFGYLSGVVTTLWNPTAHLLEAGHELLTGTTQPAAKPKEKVAKVVVKKASRAEIVSRTRQLIKKLQLAESTSSKLMRTEELNRHLMDYPASRSVLVQENPEMISRLLRQVSTTSDVSLRGESRICLALCGYHDPPKASGIRILSIDGGGTRGLIGLEILGELERILGGRITDHFDLISGVSTGAIISVMLAARRMKVREVKETYMEISRRLFSQTRLSGVSGLLLSHSYYNTKKWMEILKSVLGEEQSVIDTAREENAVKLVILSCLVNAQQLQPYVFRNYEHPSGRDSHFRGGTKHKLWQAIQASAAAPGYFEEVSLGTTLHQDGGVLANNPTAIALHEARLLWPHERVQCVVSVGNGRSVNELELTSTITNTGIQDKITKIVDSATDTELVHMSMTDLLEPRCYFRLNAYMSQHYTLDEVSPERLAAMNRDARAYVRRNRLKIRGAALQLSKPAPLLSTMKRAVQNMKNRNGMYKAE